MALYYDLPVFKDVYKLILTVEGISIQKFSVLAFAFKIGKAPCMDNLGELAGPSGSSNGGFFFSLEAGLGLAFRIN